MPTWLKVLLALLGVGVVAFAAFFFAIVGGLVWFGANADDLKKEELAAKAEGRSFGETHSADQCLTEGIRWERACGGFGVRCQMQSGHRMSACINAAHDSPELCSQLPPASDIVKSTSWVMRECRKRDRFGSQACQRALQDAQRACADL